MDYGGAGPAGGRRAAGVRGLRRAPQLHHRRGGVAHQPAVAAREDPQVGRRSRRGPLRTRRAPVGAHRSRAAAGRVRR